MIVYQIFSDPINPVWCFYLNKINIDFTDIIPVKQSNISIPGSRKCLFHFFNCTVQFYPFPLFHTGLGPHIIWIVICPTVNLCIKMVIYTVTFAFPLSFFLFPMAANMKLYPRPRALASQNLGPLLVQF